MAVLSAVFKRIHGGTEINGQSTPFPELLKFPPVTEKEQNSSFTNG